MKDKFVNSEGFIIHVEQLRHGHVKKFQEEFSPDFIDVKEDTLIFKSPVFVEGEVYLVDHELVLHLKIATEATLPCRICNELVKVPIQLEPFYVGVPLEEIKGGVFSMVDTIREAVLVEAPIYAECGKTTCLNRKDLEKFFHKPDALQEQDGYRPFEGLK